MLKLQTKVNNPKPNFSINYNQAISFFGSCFSNNIGKKFHSHKFNVCVNPFGVLYNPASIAQAIDLLFNKNRFSEDDINLNKELWFSYYHHSAFSNTNKKDCLTDINTHFVKAKVALKSSDIIFITLGTSWIYRLKKTNQIVANCHKTPPNDFLREFLEPDEIVALLSKSIGKITANKPTAKFIFTISPIRHWKDGAIENMRSKAALILAIKTLQEKHQQIFYFPSYEIFMDELRDYRYYASDMLHPSELSIEYLWEIVQQTFFNKETTQLLKEVEKLRKSFNHRPFNTDTELYKQFVSQLIESVEKIENKYPSIKFSEEKNKLA